LACFKWHLNCIENLLMPLIFLVIRWFLLVPGSDVFPLNCLIPSGMRQKPWHVGLRSCWFFMNFSNTYLSAQFPPRYSLIAHFLPGIMQFTISNLILVLYRQGNEKHRPSS
jgi:hypothetical protein